MSTNPFLAAFEKIDEDFSGEITADELAEYMRKNNYKEEGVQKWMDIFDEDKSGTITIEEFEKALGLVANQAYIEKVMAHRQHSERGNSFEDDMKGVIIVTLAKNMPEDQQRKLVNLLKAAAKEKDANEGSIAKMLKGEMDLLFGKQWNIVVHRHQIGSLCTHDEGGLFHFRFGTYYVLAWKISHDS